jgi:hypothetical protein
LPSTNRDSVCTWNEGQDIERSEEQIGKRNEGKDGKREVRDRTEREE